VEQLYAVLLMVSGVLLLVVGGTLSGQSKGARILNLLVGLAFFGYGFYLEFLFGGGSYFVFFYAFVVPILLTINAFKARKAAQRGRAQRAMGQAPPAPQPQAPFAPQPGHPEAR
jgi:hypothetical protein